MRIAVNTRFLLHNKLEGFGWFTHEVMSRMVKNHPEHEFFFFFDRPFNSKFIYANNVTPVVLSPPARHPILFKIWFNYSVKKALKKHQIDLFFSPDGYLSLTSPVKQIGVIHDLNFEHYPQDLPKNARKYLVKYFPKFAKKAHHIITVSEYSKRDIEEKYQINPQKITVAYNGTGDFFHPISEEEKQAVKAKFTGGNNYFLFVGALHPRKNITTLFKAFEVYKSQNKTDVKLVVVGEKYWWNKDMETVFNGLQAKGDILFTGHLQAETLNQVYGGALALVFPSYFEGFGIPLVEAMKCRVPIVSSRATCLPEIAGETALYFNPFEVNELVNCLEKMEKDADLRQELIKKGEERQKQFSWDNTAHTVWKVIENA